MYPAPPQTYGPWRITHMCPVSCSEMTLLSDEEGDSDFTPTDNEEEDIEETEGEEEASEEEEEAEEVELKVPTPKKPATPAPQPTPRRIVPTPVTKTASVKKPVTPGMLHSMSSA
jgi:hypothetical protein